MYDATTVQNQVTGVLTSISQILTTNLGLALGVLAALVGLGIIIRMVYKHIGGNELTYDMEYDHDMRNRTWHVGNTMM